MALVKRPILVTEVVQPGGARQLRLQVYCATRAEPIALDTCRACGACVAISGESSSGSSWVECKPAPTGDDAGAADREPSVGLILSGHTLCVRGDLSVADLPELFLQEDISVLFVVDSENEFLGAIEEMNLLRAKGADFFRRSSSPEMRDDASRPTLTAAEIMSTPRLAHDDDSIHGALVEMAHTHSRRVPVVTKTGELVGTLRDLDAMSALVAHKRNPQPK